MMGEGRKRVLAFERGKGARMGAVKFHLNFFGRTSVKGTNSQNWGIFPHLFS